MSAPLLVVQFDGPSKAEIRATLVESGHDPLATSSIADAEHAIDTRKPKLALLDLALPAAAKFIAYARSRTVPIIGISEHPSRDLAEWLEAGVTAFVYPSLPDLPGQLAIAIRQAATIAASPVIPAGELERLAGLGTWNWEIATDRLYWSQATSALLGREQQSATLGQFFTWIPEDERDRVRTALQRVMNGNRAVRYQHQVIRPDGEPRILEASACCQLNAAGEPERIIGTFRDISEMSDTQEQLRNRSELLQSVLDNIPVMIAVYGPEGEVRLFNRALERLSGWTTEEARDSDIMAEMYPDPQFREGILESAATPGWRDFAITTRSGDTLESSWANVRLSDGTRIGIGLDIRSRKAHEDRLIELNDELDQALQRWRDAYQEAEQRRRNFESLAENSPDVISRFDRELRHLYVNQAIERLTGLPRQAFIDHTHRELTMPAGNVEFWQSELEHAFTSGEPNTTDFEWVDADGNQLVFEWYVIPEYGLDGTVDSVLTVARDVTARVVAERASRQANEQLRHTIGELRTTQEHLVESEKRAALGTLATGVANELANPLMGVMGYVDYARRNPKRPDWDEKLARAEHQLERMRDIIQSVFSFARPVEEPVTDVAIPALLQNVAESLRNDFEKSGIQVSCTLEADLPPVHAKPAHLERVFRNLLLNARDAVMPCPEKRITIRSWRCGTDLCVEVADTGRGIPEAHRHQIFNPFFTTKDTGQGTGMGLTLSRNIIEDLGGELTFASEEGKGSRFLVRLRLV